MYLHLGQETLANTREIIGLFDLDTTSVSTRTRQYLAAAEKAGQVVNVSTELPKSFVVVAPPKTRKGLAGTKKKARGKPVQAPPEKRVAQRLYISQLAAATLKKRMDLQQQQQTIL